jgi:hypothetical protein
VKNPPFPKKPPFPGCPACGLRFGASGVWRPRGDSRDVIVFFHGRQRRCEAVYGYAVNDDEPLIRLGSLSDYQGNLKPIIEGSDFLFDLTEEADGGAAPQVSPDSGDIPAR